MEERGVDQITEVTNTSWFARLGQAIVGVLIGLMFVVVSIGVLFWNEGRAIRTAQGLAEGAGIVRSVSADSVDRSNDGRLIHVAGMLSTAGPVSDPDFGLKVQGVRLVRHVEVFQWKEETHSETRAKFGGGEERTTTYKYVRTWSDKPIDSDRFKEPRGHTNPVMTYQSRDLLAAGTRLGAFAVPDSLLRGFGEAKRVAATEVQANALQIRVNKPVAVNDGVLYVGRDPSQPAIGDMRISFAEVPLQTASVVAAQAGSGFAPFSTHTGTTVELIAAGTVPPKVMFQHAQEENVTMTWVLRLIGMIFMLIGFNLVLRPLAVAGSVIPLLGDVIGAGTFLVALVCTTAIAPIVIAFGWLWYRPLVGVGVLVVGAAATWGLSKLLHTRAAAKKPARLAA
ncbi:TMEM43 family protein [Reyranella sp.]|uniref:TMEM43 family protein n=1 Tax=Reyranella sp. TaxID=1929291 RepID=UPI00271997B8|nr:TMEM43 family protein [Reyranella sp.]MDO8974780.1 TMEM43 family protein [Reyranella sp.]